VTSRGLHDGRHGRRSVLSSRGRVEIRPVDDQTIILEGGSRFDNPRIPDAATEGVMLKVEPEVDVRVEIVAVKEA